jgi:hypothetical protein
MGCSLWLLLRRGEGHNGCCMPCAVAAPCACCAMQPYHGTPLTPDAPPFPNYRRSQGAAPSVSGVARTGRKREGSSRYIGVAWDKAKSSFRVSLWDPQTKRSRHVGSYASEEDAARAYDCAAVQARGPGAERNFPDETISELPATVGEERKSSRYIGVIWHKTNSSFRVQLSGPSKRTIGYFASEEDAARAYDHAAVQARGPGAKRNFPDEDISEPPVTVGEEQKQRSSSRYIGVSWNKVRSAWTAQLKDPQTKRQQHIGYFASEEDAARAYDHAAVQARGPGAKRNFPGDAISEPPATLGEKRKQRKISGPTT